MFSQVTVNFTASDVEMSKKTNKKCIKNWQEKKKKKGAGLKKKFKGQVNLAVGT